MILIFRIGDFSKLTQVSIRMLRYYDNQGLLKPANIDRFTGYRYYSATQIPDINLIISLRDMGFSVSEIKSALQFKTDEELKQFLIMRQNEVLELINEEKNRLKRINYALTNIKRERINMSYNVKIKEIPSLKVVSLRKTIADYSQEGQLWAELGRFIGESRIKPNEIGFSVYHDHGYKEKDVDVEIFMGVSELGQSNDNIKFKETQPIKKAASILVSGDYSNLKEAYAYLAKWIEDNNYNIVGKARQSLVKGPWNEENPENYVTEVVMPIA